MNVIGNRAFSDCFCLEEVLFPSSIKYIGTLAFANCKDIKMKRLNNTKPCENKENSNKTEIGLNLEEVGIWISCFVLLSKDDESILKYENSTIVFNYKLFYSEQDLYSLIRTILTSEQDALKILFFSIKLFVLYGTLEELDKMLCILGSLVFGPSSPSKKELEETRELAYRCRYFIYGKEDKHIQFEQIAKTYCYDYDYSALDKLLISNFQTMNCFFCGKPSLVINKERNIYICFHCNKYGRVTDLDIVKKTQRKEKLKYYDEIYNELKKEHYIKTKKYALYGIKFYKLNMYFIDPILYEDEDVLYELIKNKAFTNNYMQLKILNDYRFQERILELDENNDIYIKNNILLDDDFAEEAFETYSNNDSKLDIPNSDFYKNFEDEILLSDDEILF